MEGFGLVKRVFTLSLVLSLMCTQAAFAASAGIWRRWELSPERFSGSSYVPDDKEPVKFDGNVGWTDGLYGKSLCFDGGSSLVLYSGASSGLDLPKDSITVEAWAKTDSWQSWQGIVNFIQDNGTYERGFFLGFINYEIYAGIATKGDSAREPYLEYVRVHTAYELGRWYHIAFSYDGSAMRLYVDGALVDESKALSGPIAYPEKASLVLGSYIDDDEKQPLKGAIREVRIYAGTLTADEIRASKPGAVEPARAVSKGGARVIVVLTGGRTLTGFLTQIIGSVLVVVPEEGGAPLNVPFSDIVAILPL